MTKRFSTPTRLETDIPPTTVRSRSPMMTLPIILVESVVPLGPILIWGRLLFFDCFLQVAVESWRATSQYWPRNLNRMNIIPEDAFIDYWTSIGKYYSASGGRAFIIVIVGYLAIFHDKQRCNDPDSASVFYQCIVEISCWCIVKPETLVWFRDRWRW